MSIWDESSGVTVQYAVIYDASVVVDDEEPDFEDEDDPNDEVIDMKPGEIIYGDGKPVVAVMRF